MQYALIIFTALFLDGLSAALSLSIASATTGVGGLLQLIPFVGTALGTATWATGLIFGFIINISLNFTLGAGFLLMLSLNGMFYWKIVAWGGGELIPGINNLPFWTLIAVRSCREHAKRSGEKLSTKEISTTLSTRASAITAQQELAKQKMDEIRPRAQTPYATAT